MMTNNNVAIVDDDVDDDDWEWKLMAGVQCKGRDDNKLNKNGMFLKNYIFIYFDSFLVYAYIITIM